MANISIANNKGKFPEGLRVLVVDDDPTFLKVLHTMLRKCLYQVTVCGLASEALAMLKKNSFDIMISDVNMPHMDGFTLLKQVELETNLPVIMVSGNGDTNAVMKGIEHGACDYLIKPVRIHELKNIWQHVFRRKRNKRKELENSGGVEDEEKTGLENANNTPTGTIRQNNHNEEEDHGDQENGPSTLKKPRFIWTVDLHQRFEHAVNYLGIENAGPKKILELLPVKGLTREIVASHLQKYRASRKRSYGGGYLQPALIYPPRVMPEENYDSKIFHGRFKVPAIIPSGRTIPQSSVILQNELPESSKMKNKLIEEEHIVQAPNEIVNCNPLSGITFGNLLMNAQTNNLQMSPNQFEIEKYSQIQCQISSLNDENPLTSDTSLGFNKTFQKNATLDVASETVGYTCSFYYNYLVNQHENVFTFPEDLQLQVQPQSPEHQGTHALNMLPVDGPQTQLLSNDFRPFSFITDDSISGDDIIGCSNSLRVNRMSPLASVDYLEDGSHPNIDNKNHDIPTLSVENFSLSKSIGLSVPPSSIVRDFELQVPGLKSPGGIYETRTSQNMYIGLDETVNQSSRLDWEGENTTQDPDLSQIVNSTQFQGYSQAASGFDALNILRYQQRKVNLVTEQFELPSRLASEAEPQSTVRTTQSQRVHCVVDHGLEFEGEYISDLIGHRQADGGLLLDQFSPSYNTMNLVL